METFQTHPKSLKHMLSAIDERQLALPDFQRDFVWDARATEELIESISRSFPAGSLLVMPWRENTFSPRAIAGAPHLDGATPHQLILDGQQRLSSLYQACYGAGEYRYYVDFKPLMELDDVEEAVQQAVFYKHRNRNGAFKRIEQQAERLVLPLGELFGGHGFHAWLDRISPKRTEEGDQLEALREKLRRAYDAYVEPIVEYRFPVVELASSTSLEAVCSIFETLNRTGIRLSVFDLLAARFYAKELDLRRKWDQMSVETPIVEEFEIDRYYVLQSIALRAMGSVKRGDVLALTVGDVEQHWDGVVNGYRAGLEMLRDECGVKSGKWLPYGYLLVPIAAIWSEAVEIAGPTAGANRERLKQWFWCSGLSAAYDRAANTQASRDFSELRTWINGGDRPTTVANFHFERHRLREITPKQQAVYKALMASVISAGARDFHHGNTVTPASIGAERVDDHHIFPRAYLNPTGEEPTYEWQLVDCILNRTMIDASTNQRIGKRPPADYMAEIRTALESAGTDLFAQVLASHLLPAGPDSPLLTSDFEAFLDWREERIAERLEELTGVPIPASQ